MSVRILHCGNSTDNYYTCIDQKLAGFTRRGPQVGDLIYLIVRPDKKTYCGARGVLSEVSDKRPWENADAYPQVFTLTDLEFCNPFDISILSETGGAYWTLKYLQAAKAINDEDTVHLLDVYFSKSLVNSPHRFEESGYFVFDFDDNEGIDSSIRFVKTADEHVDSRLNIGSTFLTIKFHSEQHDVYGLEPLVNENFHSLFDEFPEDRTVLIQDNRMFKTAGMKSTKNERISGISGIPDSLLIRFSKEGVCPLQINLIEYECYGEAKSKPVEKFNYLNGHIIPQLMRFASTFSVVTDGAIREQTIRSWVQKVIHYIYDDEVLTEKVAGWVRKLYPNIKEQQISLHINNLLEQAFRTNIRVVLIIDELTPEQRDTIKNVINSFKLDAADSCVGFSAFVVRLQQRINTIDANAEYAISVQKQ